MLAHGASGYSRGCRCDECRAGHATRMRLYYQRKGGNKNRKPEHVKPGARGRYPETFRAADQRRRARKLGAEVEKFATVEVFERDGWVCGICGDRVDASLAYPDLMSASLDHIVQLAHGGAHTRANTRCSHLVCNMRRPRADVA